jgi:hypothetical protein
MRSALRCAVVIAVFIVATQHPALAAENDTGGTDGVCPAQYSYQDCVALGYFNQYGSGQNGTGTGATGGYCQNVVKSIATTYILCSDGGTYPCPNNSCYDSPNSKKWCSAPVTAGCCPDGTHEGQDVTQNSCS